MPSACCCAVAEADCAVVVTVETIVETVVGPVAPGADAVVVALAPAAPKATGFRTVTEPLALTPSAPGRGVIVRVAPVAVPETSLTFRSALPEPPLLTFALAPGARENCETGPKSTGVWLA